MGRTFLAFSATGGTLAWLVLSYLPGPWTTASVSFPAGTIDGVFRTLLIGGVAAFLLIQFWLLGSTARFLGRSRQPVGVELSGSNRVVGGNGPGAQGRTARIQLSRPVEIVWTAVPLAMTIGLAVLSSGH
jgi:hypothetical protein